MRRVILFMLFLWTFNPVSAQTTEANLKKLALDFVKSNALPSISNLNIRVLPLSSHLKLPSCDSISLSFQDPQHLLGRKTLSVSCPKPYWQLYMQVIIRGEIPVVIANTEMLQGSTLDSSNLKTKMHDTNNLTRPYFSSIKLLGSAKSKTYISRGHLIEPSMVERQYTVPKGKVVMIVSKNKGVYVKAMGVALDGGMKGDNIRVRNNSSKRNVYATIINALEVSVYG